MKISTGMMLRNRALDISRALGKDGASLAATDVNATLARTIAAERDLPSTNPDVRAKVVDAAGLVRNGLIPSAIYDGFTAAQTDVIPSQYDESPAEFLSSMRALFAVPALQVNDLNGSAIASSGVAEFTITPTTPGPVAVPGVRFEIGIGPFVAGIGQASLVISGRPTSLPPGAPADALQVLARLILSPVAGKICVARVLFGTPNLWGRRMRIPTQMSGPEPVYYTPGSEPTLPATAQARSLGLKLSFTGLPDGTIVRAWPLIPGSPFFESDVASLIGAAR